MSMSTPKLGKNQYVYRKTMSTTSNGGANENGVSYTRAMDTTGPDLHGLVKVRLTEEYSRTSTMENVRRDYSALRDFSNSHTMETTPLSVRHHVGSPHRHPPIKYAQPNFRALPSTQPDDDSSGEDDDDDPSTMQILPRQRIIPRKMHRVKQYKNGQRALLEIRKLQRSVHKLIPKRPFQRLVREVTQNVNPTESKLWQSSALEALQEASEAVLLRLFEDCHHCTIHRKRRTLMPSDVQLVRKLQNY